MLAARRSAGSLRREAGPGAGPAPGVRGPEGQRGPPGRRAPPVRPPPPLADRRALPRAVSAAAPGARALLCPLLPARPRPAAGSRARRRHGPERSGGAAGVGLPPVRWGPGLERSSPDRSGATLSSLCVCVCSVSLFFFFFFSFPYPLERAGVFLRQTPCQRGPDQPSRGLSASAGAGKGCCPGLPPSWRRSVGCGQLQRGASPANFVVVCRHLVEPCPCTADNAQRSRV